MKHINEYFSYDEKISRISEYLISKKHNKVIGDPSKGCTIEDICNWLKLFKVDNFVKYDGCINKPAIGELLCEIGPCNNPTDIKNAQKYWIALIGNPTGTNYQEVVCKPNGVSNYKRVSGYSENIEFEQAIDLMKFMIENPNKLLQIK